jgi:hypothetical protein
MLPESAKKAQARTIGAILLSCHPGLPAVRKTTEESIWAVTVFETDNWSIGVWYDYWTLFAEVNNYRFLQ